jgi:hypothetical protein
MKNYKYFFGIAGLIGGGILGYIVGLLADFLLIYLIKLFAPESFSVEGVAAYLLPILLALLPILLFAAPLITGIILGWKYGYRIGKKKDDNLNRLS